MADLKIEKNKSLQNKPQAGEEVLLGIDHGEKRIGLAFSRDNAVAPLHVLSRMSELNFVNEISKVCKDNHVTKIIIGLPLDSENKETAQSLKVRRFAKLLRVYVKIPQEFVNEIDSSSESMEDSISYGITAKSTMNVDHIAAAVILKKYLRSKEDAKPHNNGP